MEKIFLNLEGNFEIFEAFFTESQEREEEKNETQVKEKEETCLDQVSMKKKEK